jgi:hypothetical protein
MMLILFLLPAVLTTLFMIHGVRGTLTLIVNFIPALGVGILLALIGVPLLSNGLSQDIMDSSLWAQGQKAQNLIVGATAIAALFVLWLQRPPKHHGKHKKH